MRRAVALREPNIHLEGMMSSLGHWRSKTCHRIALSLLEKILLLLSAVASKPTAFVMQQHLNINMANVERLLGDGACFSILTICLLAPRDALKGFLMLSQARHRCSWSPRILENIFKQKIRHTAPKAETLNHPKTSQAILFHVWR